jgi:hypothetical protein
MHLGGCPSWSCPGDRPSRTLLGHSWPPPRHQGQPCPFLLPSEMDLIVPKSWPFFRVDFLFHFRPLASVGARLIRAMSKSHYFLAPRMEVRSFISGIYTPLRRQSLPRTRSRAIVDAGTVENTIGPHCQDNVRYASTVYDSLFLASQLVWCQKISVNGNFASCFAPC